MVDVVVPSIVNIEVGLLKVDGANPNKMETKQFEALKANIMKYGFLHPVITNKDYLIADGEHRYLAALELGMKEVPCIVLPLEEVDRKLLRQVLNKLHGEHDKRLDFEEFKWLERNNSIEELQRLLGSPDQKLELYLGSVSKSDVDTDDIEAVAKNITVNVQAGELWRLGDHLLLCGDSTKKADVLRLVGDAKVDMVFTDPPYNVSYSQYKYGHANPINGGLTPGQMMNDSMSREEFEVFIRSAMENMFLVNKGTFYICMSNKELPTIMRLFDILGGHWSSTIIWNKNTFVLGRQDYQRKYEPILYGFKESIEATYEPILYGWVEGEEHYYNGDRGQSDVWDIEKPIKNDLHPTMKPILLMERAIVNSTKAGMTVLDLFGCSGGTLIACEHLGRKCLMMELDPHFASIILERWQRVSGKVAEKVA